MYGTERDEESRGLVGIFRRGKKICEDLSMTLKIT